VTLETLIGEEAILAFLAIQWWSIVNHFRMNLASKETILVHLVPTELTSSSNYLHFVDPLHVIAQLIQIFNISITNFANDKLRLSSTWTLSRLHSSSLLLLLSW
jgi:hypothetical protein